MKKLCECGCRRAIEPKPRHKYYPVRFIAGHMSNEGRARARKPRYVPDPKDIPSGICECGCGKGPTGIAPRVEKAKRWFRGHHVPYLPGHSPKRTREQTSRWAGGRVYTIHGYVLLLIPEHPHADPKGYVREHRYVWEQANGRILESHEHIHHINGIKDDNRLENLVMLTKVEHAKEHAARALIAYRKARPGFNSRAGKKGAAVRWKGHIKSSAGK